MAQKAKARNQALKDIAKDLPAIRHINDLGEPEVLSVSANQLKSKKNVYLNRMVGIRE